MEQKLTIINNSSYNVTIAYEGIKETSTILKPQKTTKIKLIIPQTISLYLIAINWLAEVEIKQTKPELIIEELTKINIHQGGLTMQTVSFKRLKQICGSWDKKQTTKTNTYDHL